jgi:ATP-dependent exoDNAse (exonuclease V) alpha subunit
LPNPSAILQQKFPYLPTPGQQKLFTVFDSFIDKKQDNRLMILQGYAGTGKTSVVSALVKTLPLFNYKYLLLAPTGRAAKVLSAYTERGAFTIHKIIYKQIADPKSGQLKFKRVKNYNKNTIFVIDEASMLSEGNSFGESGVLKDLLTFVFEHDSNKLLLIGDTAQLPPVGQTLSPGLDRELLQATTGKNVLFAELDEVMRQNESSGILMNATELRRVLSENEVSVRLKTAGLDDIFQMSAERLADGLNYAYAKFGMHETIVVCRSNRDAVQYNRHIRDQLLFRSEEIEAGDVLMIVRNNYFYVPDDAPSGFLANGDFVEITKVVSLEERYSLRFATLRLQLINDLESEPFEAKVILDTLHTNSPALTKSQNKELYEAVLEDYTDIMAKKELNEALRIDPYLNALQIKFAYAITCHKSQGGQWQAVFVDQGYLTEELINSEFIRWLYTAITRASKELFLINFHQDFFTLEQ